MFDPEFEKYPSIDNTYRTATINRIKNYGIDYGDWVVLNKVNGTNFTITTDGEGILCSKKTSFIDKTDGGFNGYQKVVEDLVLNGLLDAAKELLDIYGGKEVSFCGELAGGKYNHPDVPRIPHATKVQKGVLYAPFNFFYLFDIKVDGEFLSHDTVIDIGMSYGIFFAEPLLRGTLDECLAYDIKFQDPIHSFFDLPPVEGDNFSEGVVIKPNTAAFFPNENRVILKSKTDKFKECNGERKNRVPQIIEWSDQGSVLCDELGGYINLARLRNVLSHGHVITQKDFSKLMGLFSKDVWKDFVIDFGLRVDLLEEKEVKRLKKQMNQWVAEVIRPEFISILDGEF